MAELVSFLVKRAASAMTSQHFKRCALQAYTPTLPLPPSLTCVHAPRAGGGADGGGEGVEPEAGGGGAAARARLPGDVRGAAAAAADRRRLVSDFCAACHVLARVSRVTPLYITALACLDLHPLLDDLVGLKQLCELCLRVAVERRSSGRAGGRAGGRTPPACPPTQGRRHVKLRASAPLDTTPPHPTPPPPPPPPPQNAMAMKMLTEGGWVVVVVGGGHEKMKRHRVLSTRL